MAEYLDILLGGVVAEDQLQLRRSHELVSFLRSGTHPYARLRELRSGGLLEGETIIFEVDVEVSQLAAVDIRDRELVSITFDQDDKDWPEVLALRENFPTVLHTNLRPFSKPKSLCLYEARFPDARSSWTTISIVERVREWLRDAAAGVLHQPNQPVEQLFLVTPNRIILPSALEYTYQEDVSNLSLRYFDRRPWGELLLCREESADASTRGRLGHTLFSFVSPVVTQAPIRREPQSLGDIQEIYAETGRNFFEELRQKVSALEGTGVNLAALPVILITFPRSREAGGEIERVERWGFICNLPLGELGNMLGLWQLQDGIAAHLIGADVDVERAREVSVTILNPSYALSPQAASLLTGTEPKAVAITAVGMGALGSQVAALLARTGLGRWTLVDGDVLLPHNIVRHLSGGGADVCEPKVEVARAFLDGLFDSKIVDQTIFGEVLRDGLHSEPLRASLQSADLVLDFSASASVERELARMASAASRCVCGFLNPSGTALVLFAEDGERSERLDALEMQYYRALIRDERLKEHLPSTVTSLRYARSCGDVSARMPSENVTVFAGLTAKALRRTVDEASASIAVYQMDAVGQVACVEVPVSRTHHVPLGEWTLQFDEATLEKMLQMRAAVHPAETGGVIVGVWDLDAKTLYVVDVLPAPSDSEQSESNFVRGTEGLKQALTDIANKTANVIQYVGEWHSHPDGFAANPSVEDLILYGWLGQRAKEMGLASVMAILAQDQVRWICDGHSTRAWFDATQFQTEVIA